MSFMESVYAPRGVPSKRLMRKESPLSHSFDPFVWDPPNPELGGGAWIPPTPPPTGNVNEGVELGDGNGIIAKSRGQSPASFQNLLFASRDKESLLEEIIQLKRMLIDQAFYLKRDKVHASAVQIENKKLENDIKDMEMQGNMAARTNGSTRVRLKLQGMKSQHEELQNICDSQHEEIILLRRDVRISHQREIEMEKEVFVEEIDKLQKDVKKLKIVHSQLCCENSELSRLRDKADEMEMLNYHLDNCMEVSLKALDKASREILAQRQKLAESSLLAKRSSKRSKALEDQIALAKDCLEKEKLEKKNLEEKRVCLEQELAKAEEILKAQCSKLGSSHSATPGPNKLKSTSPRSARTV